MSGFRQARVLERLGLLFKMLTSSENVDIEFHLVHCTAFKIGRKCYTQVL